MSTTFYVGNETDLNTALAEIDLGGADASPNTAYSIVFTQSIELTTALSAINLTNGSSLSINGSNYILNGDGNQQGIFDYSGALTVNNLTIAGTEAVGGSGSGGGAGLGGGLFVASGASANLDNVNFLFDKAVGGPGGGVGGGGGLGGNGSPGGGGGGIGSTAVGGGSTSLGGPGIVLGEPNGGGGGQGYSYYYQPVSFGGGIGPYTSDGQGGFGGGGGAAQNSSNYYYNEPPGGNGGFGGGGGSGANNTQYYYYSYYPYASGNGGNGGFGGGGGISGTASYPYYYYYYPSVVPGTPGFGGGTPTSNQYGGGVGGGGLGAGGAIFVQQGGSLTYSGGSIFDGSVQGGSAGQSNAGSAFGSGIFLQGNQDITLAPQAGSVMTVADGIADQTGSGGTGANAGTGGVIVGDGATRGTVALSGVNTYTGGTFVESGTLELVHPGSAGTGSITISKGAVLQVDTSALPTNVIGGLATGGAIDLRGVPYGLGRVLAIRSGLAANATLTVYSAALDGTVTQTTLKLDDAAAPLLSQVITEDDGQGGTLVLETPTGQAPCFASGTMIECEDGRIAVDRLEVGTRVRLAGGGTAETVWIGHRRQRDGSVVRIGAHALARNVPARDLIVSDDHGIYLDGVLIPAGLLVNGETITTERRDDVTLWHVELTRHAVLLAEEAPAESYLDTGNRARFGNCSLSYDPIHDASPDDPCAEMVFGGPRLDAIRARLPTMA